MNVKRALAVAIVVVAACAAAVLPTADASIAYRHVVRSFAVEPVSSVSSGFSAVMKQASNPRLAGKATVKPRVAPAAVFAARAAAPVARAAAPAVGRFAAKWAKRGAVAVGGAAAVSAGKELGKDAYSAAKGFGKKVIGIWN